MERRYGRADRIWVGDRGMVSAENIAFLKPSGRRYIVGTPKSMLKQFERELLAEDWQTIRDGLEVKLCPSPDGEETFVLCRSRDRREKEKAMHGRFERRIEEGLQRIEASCQKQRLEPVVVAQRAGPTAWARTAARRAVSHRGPNTPPTAASTLAVEQDRGVARLGRLERRLLSAPQQRHRLERRGSVEGLHPIDRGRGRVPHPQERSADCVRSGTRKRSGCWPTSWSASWPTCFGRRSAQRCQRAGLGHEPRRVFEELGKIQLVDVVLPTRQGTEIRRRCVTQPTDHQAILLTHLELDLPNICLTEGV